MDKIQEFHNERKLAIEEMSKDVELKELADKWARALGKYDYAYNLTWLGVPILQLSNDILLLQEIIWKVQPDLVIETGLAYGGSIIFTSSMLELLGGERDVIGIDIEIRKHNREAIESHPMFKNITLIEASSTDEKTINILKEKVKGKKSVLVILDSNHTHEHVLKELELYSEFVTKDSYIVAFDTNIEMFHDVVPEDKPWGKGNNPWSAVQEFVNETDAFEIDKSLEDKIVFTSAPDGYLKRVK